MPQRINLKSSIVVGSRRQPLGRVQGEPGEQGIRIDPSSVVRYVTQEHTFRSGALGEPTRTVWLKNSAEIPGSDGRDYLTLTNLSAADEGSYQFRAFYGQTTHTSTVANLGVKKANPTITQQPVGSGKVEQHSTVLISAASDDIDSNPELYVDGQRDTVSARVINERSVEFRRVASEDYAGEEAWKRAYIRFVTPVGGTNTSTVDFYWVGYPPFPALFTRQPADTPRLAEGTTVASFNVEADHMEGWDDPQKPAIFFRWFLSKRTGGRQLIANSNKKEITITGLDETFLGAVVECEAVNPNGTTVSRAARIMFDIWAIGFKTPATGGLLVGPTEEIGWNTNGYIDLDFIPYQTNYHLFFHERDANSDTEKGIAFVQDGSGLITEARILWRTTPLVFNIRSWNWRRGERRAVRFGLVLGAVGLTDWRIEDRTGQGAQREGQSYHKGLITSLGSVYGTAGPMAEIYYIKFGLPGDTRTFPCNEGTGDRLRANEGPYIQMFGGTWVDLNGDPVTPASIDLEELCQYMGAQGWTCTFDDESIYIELQGAIFEIPLEDLYTCDLDDYPGPLEADLLDGLREQGFCEP